MGYSNETAWRHRPALLHPPQRAEICRGGFEGQNELFKLLLQVSSGRLFFKTTVPLWSNTFLSCVRLNMTFIRFFSIRSTLTEVRSIFPQVFLSSLGKIGVSGLSCLISYCPRTESPFAPEKSGPKLWPALLSLRRVSQEISSIHSLKN